MGKRNTTCMINILKCTPAHDETFMGKRYATCIFVPTHLRTSVVKHWLATSEDKKIQTARMCRHMLYAQNRKPPLLNLSPYK